MVLTFQTPFGLGDNRAQRPQTRPGAGQKVMPTEPGPEGGEGMFQAEGTLGAEPGEPDFVGRVSTTVGVAESV